MTLAIGLLQLLVCAALIARAGYVLSVSADSLADAYGWGRGWVGLALLATVTSLPELASGVSAVAWVDAPNLAVGNALGACVFNLAFLVVVDLLQRGQPMYRQASQEHLLSAAFGVVMLGFVVLSLLAGEHAPRLLHLGLYSPVLLAMYLLALACVHAQGRAQAVPAAPVPPAQQRALWRRFTLAAAVVVAAGVWLPEVADGLAREAGLSRSLVGTVLMALVTTLPEMAVTLAALRLGALDMAIANLLGSNLFNVAILVLDDAAYLRGALLDDVQPVHAVTALSAIVMTALVMIGLVMRPQGRVLRVASWVSVALAGAYLLNVVLLMLTAQ